MIERPPDPRPGPARRRGLTIADCGLIVLGFALTLAIRPLDEGRGLPPPTGDALRDAAMRGDTWLSFLHREVGRAGLALLGVAVARASRSGQALRPAELLLAVVAGPFLVDPLYHALPFGRWSFSFAHPRRPNESMQVSDLRFWAVHAAIIGLGVAALIASLRLGRRLPPPATSSMLILAVLSAAWIPRSIAPLVTLGFWWHTPSWSATGPLLIALTIVKAAWAPVPALVTALAIRDRARRPSDFGGMERTGLVLILASFLLFIVISVVFWIWNGATAAVVLTAGLISAAATFGATLAALRLLSSLQSRRARRVRGDIPPMS